MHFYDNSRLKNSWDLGKRISLSSLWNALLKKWNLELEEQEQFNASSNTKMTSLWNLKIKKCYSLVTEVFWLEKAEIPVVCTRNSINLFKCDSWSWLYLKVWNRQYNDFRQSFSNSYTKYVTKVFIFLRETNSDVLEGKAYLNGETHSRLVWPPAVETFFFW